MNREHMRDRRRKLAARAAEIAALDFKSLYRIDELGREAGFEIGSDVFERVWGFIRQINYDSLLVLPEDGLDRVERFLNDTEGAINRIRGFRLSDGNPMQLRDSFLGQLDVSYRDMIREYPAVILLTTKAHSADTLTEEYRRMLDSLEKLTEENKKAIEKQELEAEDLLGKMRQASGEVALRSYSGFFLKEAEGAKTAAIVWLVVTVLPTGFLVGYLVWLVFWWAKAMPDYSMIQAIQAGGAKLALFSVGFYLVSWCGRNFKAQWHIYVVNRHRATTLNALEAFANSTKNDSTREAVLIHASSAIFAQVHTGFIPDEADAPTTPSILEVVRGHKG